MTFPEINAKLHANASFSKMLNEDHHLGTSPFAVLPVEMISNFHFDYMPVICFGVIRKLLVDQRPPPNSGAETIKQFSRL
jgi:hypothetical protein